MRRLGAFTHATKHQTSARAPEKPGNRQSGQQGEVNHGVLLEQSRADKRQLAQAGHGVIHMHVQLFAHVSHADKGRKAAAEQADGQAGGVLVGVEPDHQQAKQGRTQRAGDRAGRKRQPGVAGVKAHGKAHHGGHQHHAFGA